MIRRYRTFYCPKQLKPDEAIRRVSKLVSDLGVRRKIPRICVERGFSGQPQYYLFIAFESDDGGLDPEIETFFLQAQAVGCRDARLEPLSRVDIATMVSQDVRVEEFARRLVYKPLVIPPAGDPFAKEEDEGLSLSEVERTQRFDHLLDWMSAHAEGSFATFDSARRALGIEMDTRRVLRALRLLGHCETSRDGSRWSIAPSTLVQTEDGCYVLAGGRDAALLRALRERFPAATEQVPQPLGTGPSAFRVRTGGPGDLSSLGVHIVPQADRALAAALPRIEGWSAMLDKEQLDPGAFTIRRLDGGQFKDVGAFEGKEGLYQLERAGPHTRAFHLYFAPELGWRRGEWTGLRFLARIREFGKARCTYAAVTQQLSVPFEWRWPEIYERALVLSSGQLPARDDNGTGAWLVYQSVERELLDLLEPLLNLEVEEA